MTGPRFEQDYDSHAAFYESVYGDVVREVRPAGRTGATMLTVEQEAGDWSDAPTPDLVINFIVQHSPAATIDVGAGRFRRSDDPAGDFIVVPPNTTTTFLVDGPHDLRFLALPYAKLRVLAGEAADLPLDGDFGPLHAGMHRDREMMNLLDRLWRECRAGSPHGTLWADGAILQVASRLLVLRDGIERPSRGGLASWQLNRAREYLSANMSSDVSLKELAAAASLSPTHFSRAFKQETGRSPVQELIAMRMQRARALLAEPKLPVIEVAALCGYDSPSAFAQVFRRETGMTPTEWRRRV